MKKDNYLKKEGAIKGRVMKKRLLSSVLAICLAVSMIPSIAGATEPAPTDLSQIPVLDTPAPMDEGDTSSAPAAYSENLPAGDSEEITGGEGEDPAVEPATQTDGDQTPQTRDATAVATVEDANGTEGYDSLQAAIEAAQLSENSKVVLQNDYEATCPVVISAGSFTLDLNGCSWTESTTEEWTAAAGWNVSDSLLYTYGGAVIVKDESASKSGAIYAKSHTAITASQYSGIDRGLNLTIESGTFSFEGLNGAPSSYSALSVGNGGNVTVKGGVFRSYGYACSVSKGANVALQGGSFEVINGGWLSALNMDSGNIADLLTVGYGYKNDSGWVTYTGSQTTAREKVSVAQYAVILTKADASVVGYDAMQDAITDAKSNAGSTITLQQDITEDVSIISSFTASVTIDLNGKKWSPSVPDHNVLSVIGLSAPANILIKSGGIIDGGIFVSNCATKTVQLSGGTFVNIRVVGSESGMIETVSDLLAENHDYWIGESAEGHWATSEEKAVISLENATVKSVGVTITQQPIATLHDQEIHSVEEDYTVLPKLKIVATKDENLEGNIEYQWLDGDYNQVSGGENDNTDTYTLPSGLGIGTHTYYCKVSLGEYFVISDPVTLKVYSKYAASVTVGEDTTYYESLITAIKAAQGFSDIPSTLKLRRNIKNNNVVSINSGTFTFDLNGYTLECTEANPALKLATQSDDAPINISIVDGSDGGEGKVVSKGRALNIGYNANVTICGGTFETESTHAPAVGISSLTPSGSVTIEGGTFLAPSYLALDVADGSESGVHLKGGAFSGSESKGAISVGDAWLLPISEVNPLLSPGYGYVGADGAWLTSGTVPAELSVQSSPVHLLDSNNDVIGGFDTVKAAFVEAVKDENANSTVKLMDNITTTESAMASSGTFTIDLNGHTLSGEQGASGLADSSLLTLQGDAAVTITDSNTNGGGKIVANGAEDDAYALWVKNTARLTIDKGAFSSVGAPAVCAWSLTTGRLVISGGEFLSRDSHALNLQRCLKGTVELSGGFFQLSSSGEGSGSIRVTPYTEADISTIGELLPDGYGFHAIDHKRWCKDDDMGTFVLYETVTVAQYPFKITGASAGKTSVTYGYGEAQRPALSITIQPDSAATQAVYEWYRVLGSQYATIKGASGNEYKVPMGLEVGTYEYWCYAELDEYVESRTFEVEVKKATDNVITKPESFTGVYEYNRESLSMPTTGAGADAFKAKYGDVQFEWYAGTYEQGASLSEDKKFTNGETPKDAGSYTLRAYVNDTNNYGAAELLVPVTITPKVLKVGAGIGFDGQSFKTYDGSTAAPSNFEIVLERSNADPNLDDIFGDDWNNLSIKAPAYAFTDANAGAGNKTITASGITLGGTEYGNASANYTIGGLKDGKLALTDKGTIHKATVVITPAADQGKTYLDPTPDLNTLGYTSTGLCVNERTGKLDEITGTLDYELSNKEGTVVGEYKYKLDSMDAGDNYTLDLAEDSPKFTIWPKQLSSCFVKGVDNCEYNGDEHNQAYLSDTEDSAIDLGRGSEYTVEFYRDGQPTTDTTSAGTVTVKFTDVAGGNYAGDPVEASFTISPRAVSFDWGAAQPLTYNGTAQVPMPEVANLVDGDVCTITTIEGSQIDATSAGQYYQATVTGLSNSNYKLPEQESCQQAYRIAPKPVTLTWGSQASFVFNGQSQAPSVSVEGLVTREGATQPDSCDVQLSGAQTNALTEAGATYTATAEGLSNENYVLAESAQTTCDFTISPKPITNDMVAGQLSDVMYDGTKHEPVIAVSDGSLMTANDYVLSWGANTNAGDATVTVTGKNNYAGSLTKHFTVLKRPLTVTVPAQSKTYGQPDPELALNVVGLAGEETAAVALTGKVEREAGEDVGDYEVLQGTLEPTDNYSLTFVSTNKFIISKANVALNMTLDYAAQMVGKDVTVTVTAKNANATTLADGAVQPALADMSLIAPAGLTEKTALHEVSLGTFEATYTVDASAALGSRDFIAQYKGSGNYNKVDEDAKASLNVTDKNTVKMSVSASKDTGVTYGDSITYTAEVTSDKLNSPAWNTLTGAVTYWLGEPNAQGSKKLAEQQVGSLKPIELTKSDLTAGTHAVYIEYSGNDSFASAVVNITTIVVPKQLTWNVDDLWAAKPHDGNATAIVNGTLAVDGVIEGEDAKFTYVGLTGAYANTEVGNQMVTVTVDGSKLGNTNYALPMEQPTFTGTINKVNDLPAPPVGDDGTLYKLQQVSGIVKIPEEFLDNENLNTLAKIETQMKLSIMNGVAGFASAGIEVYDIILMYSTDDGTTWQVATSDAFLTDGIEILLPYPAGTNKDNFDFMISHMLTTGDKAGSTEIIKPEKTADGLKFTLYSLSPVAVGYKEVLPIDAGTGTGNNGNAGAGTSSKGNVNSTLVPDTGDTDSVALGTAFVLLAAGLVLILARKKKSLF